MISAIRSSRFIYTLVIMLIHRDVQDVAKLVMTDDLSCLPHLYIEGSVCLSCTC